ncbi:MAG: S8 family serine peptidase, partial [Bacteroidales bacterium]|nr:S8 family serine peptidase [Bacteroidales bacterium]
MNKTNKILFSILFALFAQISVISQTYDDFYYAFDQKVYLNIASNKYVVEFPNGVDETLFTQNNLENEKLDTGIFEVSCDITTIQNIFGQSYYINPLYTTNDGLEISITREIVIRFNVGVPESEKADLINDYGLQLVESTRLFDLYQVANPLQISKEVFLSGLVEYCYPNFMCNVTAFDGYHPNDEYYYKQYYLHNTGQLINDGHYGTADADIDAPEAWEITKGSSNITIAVIDDGVTDNHPDLPSSRQIRLSGSNFSSGDPNDPSPGEWYEAHGNCCAGIIGATQDNWEGVSGIAPHCKIMPIRVTLSKKNKTDEYSQAISFAFDHGANIISNSWGFQDQNPYLIPALRTAIEDAIEGGCIVIFAAGNEADQNNYDIGYVTFPANTGISGLITVAASDRDDLQANYSPTSEMIDVSAPSNTASNDVDEAGNVWTIDSPGYDNGFNPWPYVSNHPQPWEELPSSGTNNFFYTGRMSGTSAATPQVAGCAALALSVNPGLNINQINNLIRYKSDKVGPYIYNWNQSLLGHSRELGYGRLNCFRMVETASEMHSPGVDLYTKDLESDFGIEPNEAEEGTPMWHSPDIWVRNQNDGISNQVTQNPIFGTTNYVYVRVTNIGATQSTGNELVM